MEKLTPLVSTAITEALAALEASNKDKSAKSDPQSILSQAETNAPTGHKINFPTPKYRLTRQVLFRNWKERLFNELAAHNLALPPPSNLSEEELKNYNNTLRLFIQSRIDDDHLTMVQGIQDPKDILKELQCRREPKNSLSDLQLIRKLSNLNYDGSTDGREFLADFEETVAEIE